MPVPALLFALLASSPSPTQVELLETVNGLRSQHGLAALRLDDRLSQMAAAQSRYMAANRLVAHHQVPGAPGFSGATLRDRAQAVGWRDACSELVGYASRGLRQSVQAIFDSPSHRTRFLLPGPLTLGAWSENDYVCLLVGGDPTEETVVSPPDGGTGVPTLWFGAADFSGTRFPGGRTFGYPAFLNLPPSAGPVTTQEATLTSDTGERVAVHVRDPANDPRYRSTVVIVPQGPLSPKTAYTVRVAVLTARGDRFERQWTFTTA